MNARRTFTYAFDIDDRLCTNVHGAAAQAFYEMAAELNSVYHESDVIFIYTARGATTGIDWCEVTERQLGGCEVRCYKLFWGKQTAYVCTDNSTINPQSWGNCQFIEGLRTPQESS
jgi:hypothetical protein